MEWLWAKSVVLLTAQTEGANRCTWLPGWSRWGWWLEAGVDAVGGSEAEGEDLGVVVDDGDELAVDD